MEQRGCNVMWECNENEGVDLPCCAAESQTCPPFEKKPTVPLKVTDCSENMTLVDPHKSPSIDHCHLTPYKWTQGHLQNPFTGTRLLRVIHSTSTEDRLWEPLTLNSCFDGTQLCADHQRLILRVGFSSCYTRRTLKHHVAHFETLEPTEEKTQTRGWCSTRAET